MSTILSKYLKRYAEDLARSELNLCGLPQYSHAVVVPCYAEPDISRLLKSLDVAARPLAQKVLMIIVINQRTHSNASVGEANRLLWESLKNRGILSTLYREPEVCLVDTTDAFDILMVDRFHTPFADNEGVGSARKLGSDLALRLIESGAIANHFIVTTDGDAELSANYFDFKIEPRNLINPIHPPKTPPGAFLSQFTHALTPDPFTNQAITRYDQHLRRYQEGLENAGSPFAYVAMGSAMSFSPTLLAQVRGIPKRMAGEDFHFLNKAAKIAPIYHRPQSTVTLHWRHDQVPPHERLPFGTACSVDKLLRGESASFHYPEVCFDALKQLLRATYESLLLADTGSFNPSLPVWAQEYLKEQNFLGNLSTVVTERKTYEDRLRQFHTGWDALKTLKFIHAGREYLTHHEEEVAQTP